MADTMLACVRKGPKQLSLEEKPVPKILEPTDVILNVTLCTICGTDLHFAEMPIPNIAMGHEAVGTIAAKGDAVKDFNVGDRVVMACTLSCGVCGHCQEGDHSACLHPMARVKHGLMIDGCQAEYVRVPFASFNLGKIPAAVSDEHAILAGDIFSTGLGVLERAPIRTGDSVAVFALGPLGLCVIKAARALGAGLVIGVDPDPFRREVASKMGANVVLDPAIEDVASRILRLTAGIGVNIAVEAVGKDKTLEAACKTARIGGAVSGLGVYDFIQPDIKIPLLSTSIAAEAFYHRKFVTTLCPSGRPRLERILDLIRHGGLDFNPLWTHHMPLKDILSGYEMARDPGRKSIKIAITP